MIISEEQGERFHQEIKEMEWQYQLSWNISILINYFWILIILTILSMFIRGKEAKDVLKERENIIIRTCKPLGTFNIFMQNLPLI